VKGKNGPLEVYEVTGMAKSAAPGRAPTRPASAWMEPTNNNSNAAQQNTPTGTRR
jgi:hypothetical protein